jgi:hypothetical protein
LNDEGCEVRIEEVVPTGAQIKKLYELLSLRRHSISHKDLPTYTQHESFVKKHPYRAWYIIYRGENIIGSVYVQFDNSVGINTKNDLSADELNQVVKSIRARVAPLEAIPSVRYEDFYFNVPYSDEGLKSTLQKVGFHPSQVSFVLKPKEEVGGG